MFALEKYFFFPLGCLQKQQKAANLAPIPVTWRDGKSSSRVPWRYFQEMFVTAQLTIHGWHTALWGLQPREASAWGPYLENVLERARLELEMLVQEQ